MEQLVARWAHNPKVVRSSRAPATKKSRYNSGFFALMMFTVYVLFSVTFNKIYIGYTSDLAARFLSHNKLANKGWTVKFRPWELVYTEQFNSKGEAMQREKELKSARGRIFIWELIEKNLPK